MKPIVLVGFMGCGKSDTGAVLAEKLALPLVDLDEEIERLEGKSVGRIFSEEGEKHFRMREREVLHRLEEGEMVMAVGGGAYTSDDNIALINSIATAVWLDCPIEICLERCARKPGVRPLFSDAEEMVRLFEHRKRYYKRAALRVDCRNKTPEQIADEIIAAFGLDKE